MLGDTDDVILGLGEAVALIVLVALMDMLGDTDDVILGLGEAVALIVLVALMDMLGDTLIDTETVGLAEGVTVGCMLGEGVGRKVPTITFWHCVPIFWQASWQLPPPCE
jgi:chromate transport protein ChrA